MRLLFPVCSVGALLLIAMSMAMNWTFWRGQGADATQGLIFASVSVSIDLFKSCLPLIAERARHARHWLGMAVAIILFIGCLGFSLLSAMGYASLARGMVTGGREALGVQYRAARADLVHQQARLAALGDTRPQAVVDEALARAKQDRRWSSSNGCTAATAEASLVYCREIGALKVELASAEDADRIRARVTTLETEIATLLRAGAQLQSDTQAGFIASVSGIGIENVQSSITLFFAVLVELLAAFGLYVAQLARRVDERRQPRQARKPLIDGDIVNVSEQAGFSRPPSRFVRAPDGRLMIE